jgi:hypothetical protein
VNVEHGRQHEATDAKDTAKLAFSEAIFEAVHHCGFEYGRGHGGREGSIVPQD